MEFKYKPICALANQGPIGQLTKIADKNGNGVEFNSDANQKIYSAYSSSSGITTKFVWNYDVGTNSYTDIAYIEDSSGKRYEFKYDRVVNNGVYLSKIVDSDGDYGDYRYDIGTRNLHWVSGSTGKYFYYGYTGGSVQRVNTIDAYSTLFGEYGGKLSIEHGNNVTSFTDDKGRKEFTQFNNMGHAISLQDSEGGAVHYQFGTVGNNNALTNVSKVQKTVINLEKNHNFENNSDWVFSNGFEGSTGNGNYTTADKNLGSRSFYIEKTNDKDRSTVSQWLELEKGKLYTFSGYIKTKDMAGKANLRAVFSDDASILGKVETSEDIIGNFDWSRYQISFDIPANAVSNKVLIEASVWDNKGTAYFDNFQVEEGIGANRHNLIENSNLTNGIERHTKVGDVSQGIVGGRNGGNAYYIWSDMVLCGRMCMWQGKKVNHWF